MSDNPATPSRDDRDYEAPQVEEIADQDAASATAPGVKSPMPPPA